MRAQKYPGITDRSVRAFGNNPSVPLMRPAAICSSRRPDSNFAVGPERLALLKTYPQPNVDPATHGGNNFEYLDQSPVNRWEHTGKVDYSISENTKLTVSYSRQNETDIHPVQVWWAPSWSLPYPSPLVAPTTANVVMANPRTFSAPL